MKTQWVCLEKRLLLRTHVVLRQAAACLHHTKLAWDAENGWQELRAFYAGHRGEYLRATLEEWLRHGGKVVNSEVRSALDQEIYQSLLYSHYFTPLFRLLARLGRCCRFKQHELDFVVSCLTEFVMLMANPTPPSAKVGMHLEGSLRTAEYCVEMRSGFMPEMVKASRVERIYPPPLGPIYTYDEIVSALK